ncbi:hypothetical protein ACWIGM_05270 [Bosea sp. NPDC055332]
MRDGHGNPLSPEQEAEVKARKPAKQGAEGQFALSQAKPNPGGITSANPVVLSGDGDANPGNGYGRDRDPSGPRSD